MRSGSARRQRVVGGGDRGEERAPPRARAGRRLAAPARAARGRAAGSMRSSSVRSGASPPVAKALSARPPRRRARARRPGRRARSPRSGRAAPARRAASSGRSSLRDELRAGGGVQQRLGARVDVQRRVLDQRRGCARRARRRPARAGPSAPRAARAQAGDQRRLAGAVEPLHRDQPAARHRPATVAATAPSSDCRCPRRASRASASTPIPHAAAVLGSALRGGRPSHAYLFHGPAGTRQARRRARVRRRAAGRGRARSRLARARASQHGRPSRPDLGRAERRARDAAARRRRGGRLRRRPHAVRGAAPGLRPRARRDR